MPVSAADRAAWQAAMARPFTSPLPAAPTAKPVMSAADRQAWAQQMANINPNMSGLEDVGRTLVSRPQRMVAGAVGMPRSVADVAPTALDVAGNDVDSIASLMRAAIDPKAPAPQLPGFANGISFDASQDWMPQLAKMIGRVDNPVGAALASVTSPFVSLGSLGPTQNQVDTAVQNTTGPYHDPQTLGGRVADLAVQMAPAAAFPGSAGARVARVVAPTIGGSVAGELAHGTPEEDPLRFLGAMLGGGIEGAGEAWRNPAIPANAALNSLTPDQAQAVTALRQSAARQGITLTVPEAVQHVAGGATNLGRMQALTESAPRTAPTMQAYFADRPNQIADAIDAFTSNVAPGGVRSPSVLAGDATNAAKAAQQGAAGYRGMLTRPWYEAADSQDVDRQGMADLLSGIKGNIAADQTGLVSPQLQGLADSLTDQSGRPITNIGNLSTAQNFWQGQIDLPPENASALDKQTAGIVGGHLADLDKLLGANPDWARGQELHGAASSSMVDPLTGGPIGTVAGSGDLSTQLGALFPRTPYAGQAGETGQALAALGSGDPAITNELLAQHLAAAAGESSRSIVPDQWSGARFVRNVAGNPEQAATLNEGLGVADPTGDLQSQFGDLADALQATGYRQRPGISVPFNLEQEEAQMKLAPFAVRTAAGAIDPFEWSKNLASFAGRARYGQKLDILANMMTDPDTAAVLARAAAGSGAPPYSAAAPALGGQWLLGSQQQPVAAQ